MSRKAKSLKGMGKLLYTRIEPIKPLVPGDTPEERFKNAATMVYRGWEKRRTK